LLDEKDLDEILQQERMLELEYQLKLEQWSAWQSERAPDFDSGRAAPAANWR